MPYTKETCRSKPLEFGDYMTPLFPTLVDTMKTIPIPHCHRRDELIMTRMYGLEMLRIKNGRQASTDVQLGDIKRKYLLKTPMRTPYIALVLYLMS